VSLFMGEWNVLKRYREREKSTVSLLYRDLVKSLVVVVVEQHV
jgi:hypothetical protein